MKVQYAFYAAHRYWPREEELLAACANLAARLPFGEDYTICWDDRREPLRRSGDCLVVVPFSGGVQKLILEDAENNESAILYGAYVRGNAPDETARAMLRANAAPALMDTWAVLRRTHRGAALALNWDELDSALRVEAAWRYVRGAKILKIGETEPWVVSNASSSAVYEEKLGVHILPVPQDELARRYENTTTHDAQKYYDWFMGAANRVVEPNEEDLWNASRMACALVNLLEETNAAGAAVACFNLLKTGTNLCLGASYVNDQTERFFSCEGDMDSAVTMLLMKKLARSKLWMANPGLQPDRTVNFSHCTAPVCLMNAPLPVTLRSHHESGIGVSLQVNVPVDTTVTACRISDECGSMTIHRGLTVAGPYEAACRTQVHVRFKDFDHYIRTALGCHQVFAFDNISKEMKRLAERFSLKLL